MTREGNRVHRGTNDQHELVCVVIVYDMSIFWTSQEEEVGAQMCCPPSPLNPKYYQVFFVQAVCRGGQLAYLQKGPLMMMGVGWQSMVPVWEELEFEEQNADYASSEDAS